MILSNLPYEDGIYEGQTLNGLPHGWGKLSYPGDVAYVGEWNNGVEHGLGKLIWSNGRSFTGIFNQGAAVEKLLLEFVYDYEKLQNSRDDALKQQMINSFLSQAFLAQTLVSTVDPDYRLHFSVEASV